MNKIARRAARAGSVAAAVAAVAAALVVPSTASAATPPLTISETTSSPNVVGNHQLRERGVTFGITYTIKANTASATFTNVGFTDALPPFVTLDDEVGETAKGCGTPFNATNQAGQDFVTEAGLTIVNGTTCTITVDVVSTTPDPHGGRPVQWSHVYHGHSRHLHAGRQSDGLRPHAPRLDDRRAADVEHHRRH